MNKTLTFIPYRNESRNMEPINETTPFKVYLQLNDNGTLPYPSLTTDESYNLYISSDKTNYMLLEASTYVGIIRGMDTFF